MQAAVRMLAVVLSVLVTGSLPAADGDRYMVEMDLWIDGQQRGTPIVVVPPGELSTVEVGGADDQGGWRVDVLVEPPAESEGAPSGAIWLNLTVYRAHEGDWEPLADTLLGVPEGRAGTMTVVEPGVVRATRDNSLVHLTARASLLRPGESAR